MTTYTWIGGGNNQASNAKDWLGGIPPPGSSFGIGGSGLTLNVVGDILANTTLTMNPNPATPDCADLTVKLSSHAVLSVDLYGGDPTFDLSGGSTLNFEGAKAGITANLSGSDTLNLTNVVYGPSTVNLAALSVWHGTFSVAVSSPLNVNGGADTRFDNTGTSTISDGTAVVNANVIGKGIIDVAGGKMTFAQSVGINQSVVMQASALGPDVVTIDKPTEFDGTITLASIGGQSPQIDLVGLVNASSYGYKNDMLSIYAGNRVIDTLKLVNQTPYGFEIEKTNGGVNIVAFADASHAIGTPLALHGLA